MTTFAIVLAGLAVLILVYFFVLGQISKSGKPQGLVGDQLAQCPDKPNCVCSEYNEDQDHYVPPIDIAGVDGALAMANVKLAVQSLGGRLHTEDGNYLAFVFSSSLFGFVDDVEVRIDPAKNALHLRSASRVGYSDLGVNKKRVDAIKTAFMQQTAR